MTPQRGFSLVELLVAASLTLVVAASVLGLAGPVRRAFAAQPETALVQQRLRVSADAIFDDLVMAGAGLGASVPPILPFRRGAVRDTGPGHFEGDVLTLYYATPLGAEGVLAADLLPGTDELTLETGVPCRGAIAPCGLQPGMDVLVFDAGGHFERLTVSAAAAGSSVVGVTPPTGGTTYRAGARVVQIVDRTYFLKPDPSTGASQLMSYDGSTNADLPMVDHVAGLTFEYYGADPSERLGPAELTDGPWRPDAGDPRRWDEDLLRIRRVVVTIRVESTVAGVPGREIQLQVSPRNLVVGRRP